MEDRIPKLTANLNAINELSKMYITKLVSTSEETYKKQIKNLVKVFKKGCYKAIFLSGPSSAGKTTTSNLIRKRLFADGIKSIVISLDNFFVDRDKNPKLPDGSYDFESIYALDLKCFNEFLFNLLTTKKAKQPEFDFITGKRKEKLVDIEIDDNTVVIFEGIHALNPLLCKKELESSVFRVYLCINTNFLYNNKMCIPARELRLMRRMLRDYLTRGHSIKATIDMWPNVLDGEEKYIKPFKASANFMIDTTHYYEPLLYATYLLPLLEKIDDTDVDDNLAQMLKKCNPLPESVVPKNSLLWEFLGM